MPTKASEFDDTVRNVLACPVCNDRPRLEPSDDDREFRCPSCGRRYPIKGGIPQLVDEDAIADDLRQETMP